MTSPPFSPAVSPSGPLSSALGSTAPPSGSPQPESSSPPQSPSASLSDELFFDKYLLYEVRRRIKLVQDAASMGTWALVNLFLMVSVWTEMRSRFILRLVVETFKTSDSWWSGVVFEVFLYVALFLLACNFVFDLQRFLFPLSGVEPLHLSEEEMRLLGITDDTPGFIKSPVKIAPRFESRHPLTSSPMASASFPSSPVSSGSWFNSPYSSYQQSPGSPLWTASPFAQTISSPAFSTSWTYSKPLIRRSPPAAKFNLSHDGSGKIVDEKSLDSYLKEYENWERQNNSSLNVTASPDQSLNATVPSMWQPNDSQQQSQNLQQSLDYSQILSKLKYQLSTLMPASFQDESNNEKAKSSGGLRSTSASESICYQVGINPIELMTWMENLRMWISQTVLVRLVEEIDQVNAQLIKLGMSDSLIGEVGLEKLRKISQMHAVLMGVPDLYKIVPFLELTVNQDYLVDRIRTLSKGGAMSEFRWNGGGRFKNLEWNDKLPSDAELIMHLVACYLDTRLPPVKGIIDGRVFSTLYFFRLPDKPKQKVSFAIVQMSANPPHYVLQIGDNKLEPTAGRNNMFHTLLLFLHHIKTKEDGILGRVNLGPSGINMLWVIE